MGHIDKCKRIIVINPLDSYRYLRPLGKPAFGKPVGGARISFAWLP
jgi:hypothetical protein